MQQSVRVSWHTMPIAISTRRGRRYSLTYADAVDEWERRCHAEGIPFNETQGGFNGTVAASGGTHDGDATDLSVWGLTLEQVIRTIEIGRELGFCVWFRTTRIAKWGTRAHGFAVYHIHAVPNLWGFPSPDATRQAWSYRIGRDGLASNQADLGPGHTGKYRTRTWQEYRVTRPTIPVHAPIKEAPMSQSVEAKIDTILANTASAFGALGGRDYINEHNKTTGNYVLKFPIGRGAGTTVIQEIADIRSDTIALRGMVAALTKAVDMLSDGKVDMAAVKQAAAEGSAQALHTHDAKMSEMLEGLEMSLRLAVVESMGDIDRAHAEAQADAVWDRLGELINAGAVK